MVYIRGVCMHAHTACALRTACAYVYCKQMCRSPMCAHLFELLRHKAPLGVENLAVASVLGAMHPTAYTAQGMNAQMMRGGSASRSGQKRTRALFQKLPPLPAWCGSARHQSFCQDIVDHLILEGIYKANANLDTCNR